MEASPSKQELGAFIKSTTRRQRYRAAKKTFKFNVYASLEAVFLLLSIALVTMVWRRTVLSDNFVLIAAFLIAVVGVLHHAKLIARMPWLLLAAATEGWTLWAAYNWGISRWIVIPHVYALCVAFAVTRYWDRGEDVVNERAYRDWKSRAL